MREIRSSGSVEGVLSNGHSYSDSVVFSEFTKVQLRPTSQAITATGSGSVAARPALLRSR